MKKILITGCAGFIGFHASQRFISEKFEVIGIDNLNDYYDVELKKNRIKLLKKNKKFKFYKIDLTNNSQLKTLFKKYKFNYILHLAAQAGVRHSFKHPEEYIDSNVLGFFNLIENIKSKKIINFVFASSSSVYGLNKKMPYREDHKCDSPSSLYAASKKMNETLASSYSYLNKIKFTGLRFFTVYGPWGRPDMALFKFTKNILNNRKIDLYNKGNHRRDFTYIDDIVEAIFLTTLRFEKSRCKQDLFKIYNIANGNAVHLKKFLTEIEKILKIKAKKNLLPMQPGDVADTHGDISLLKKDFGFKPKVNYKQGIKKFIDWYLLFYNK